MRFGIVLSVILCVACSSKQGEKRFTKLVYDLSKSADSIEFQQWRLKNVVGKKSKNYECRDSLYINNWTWAYCLYEDESYKILGECRGEFGGSAIFIPKKTPEKAYYLTCTCPQMIEKRADGFYITQTMSHTPGFGRILKIKNPENLIMVSVDSLSLPWQEERFKGVDRHEVHSKLSRQGQILVDTMGYTFTLFFQHNERDYLIYSKYNNTFFGEVKNHQIVFLDTLANVGSWNSNDTPNELVDGIHHNHFERSYANQAFRRYASGDIYVKHDTIVFGYIYKDWPKKEGEL